MDKDNTKDVDFLGGFHFLGSNYVKPEIKEQHGRKWVLYGENNSGFEYIIDRYNGSPTNEAIINVYCELLFGKGIAVNGQDEVYEDLVKIFPKREQKKCINDFKMFGQYAMQLVRSNGGGIAEIAHFPMDKLGIEKANENGEIDAVYYSFDWNDTRKYRPERIPLFKGKMTNSIMIKLVQPYCPGNFYFSHPDYLASLQYAELEEELSNFYINHIQNGLSFGHVINVANGEAYDPEVRDRLERNIKSKLTGSSNAGKFILSFNADKESGITVEALDISEPHSQFDFLVKEARQQLITAHGAQPNLFGIVTANGLSNNADELDTQAKLIQDYQISPKQALFIDELAMILELAGLETDLYFIPLRESYKDTETQPEDNTVDVEDTEVELSSQFDINALIELGEEINYDEWELIDDRRCDEITLRENQLNTVFQFAEVPKSDARTTSEQDTSLFKIRYRYAGNPNPEREFCKKVMRANKLYKAEDLDLKLTVNSDFAPSGEDSYNIFYYKGGTNCLHYWQRVIFLKKGNKRISVNQARKMILELEPEDREDARWKTNPKIVAQPAEKKNNYHSLQPNYRNSGVIPTKNG